MGEQMAATVSEYRSATSYIEEFLEDPENARRFSENEIALRLVGDFVQLRARSGISVEEFAARVGREPSYIQKLEAGAYAWCSVPALRSFARALGYDIELRDVFRKLDVPVHSGDVGVEPRLDAALRDGPAIPGGPPVLEEIDDDDDVTVTAAAPTAATGVTRSAREVERRTRLMEEWAFLFKAHNRGEAIELVVDKVQKGGVLVDMLVRGFVPLRQLVDASEPEALLGHKLRFKVVDFDVERAEVVLSERLAHESERDAKQLAFLKSLRIGEIRRGVVKTVTDFGAFVDLGGVDGLIHISELARAPVEQVADVVKKGDVVDVRVLKVDLETKRISLSRKRALPEAAVNPASHVAPEPGPAISVRLAAAASAPVRELSAEPATGEPATATAAATTTEYPEGSVGWQLQQRGKQLPTTL